MKIGDFLQDGFRICTCLHLYIYIFRIFTSCDVIGDSKDINMHKEEVLTKQDKNLKFERTIVLNLISQQLKSCLDDKVI